ncbi:hypothetical protein Hanom_Chr16g01473611 [Helianthus anomalus]
MTSFVRAHLSGRSSSAIWERTFSGCPSRYGSIRPMGTYPDSDICLQVPQFIKVVFVFLDPKGLQSADHICRHLQEKRWTKGLQSARRRGFVFFTSTKTYKTSRVLTVISYAYQYNETNTGSKRKTTTPSHSPVVTVTVSGSFDCLLVGENPTAAAVVVVSEVEVEVGGGGGGGRGGGVGWREKREKRRRGRRDLKRLEDMGCCLHQEEVSQTFFNETSARKQTSCRTQRSVCVCATQT